MSSFREAVGKIIADQRKRKGMTQAQVGEKLGLERETISNMETGATSLTLERLEELAELFGCPVRWFLWQEEGTVREQAEMLADMIQSVPPKRRPAIVRAVAEMVRALQN